MAIDSEIPLLTQAPQIDSPTKTMTALYGLKHQQSLLEGQNLENLARVQENAKRTRDAADDAAVRSELKNSIDPTTGQPDVPAAIKNLHKHGFSPAALKLTDEWTTHLKNQASTAEQEIKRHEADLSQGAALWSNVTDDATLAAAKRAAPAVMGPDSTKLLGTLPDTYAEAKPSIDALLTAGNKMADKLRAAHEAVTEHQYALEHGLIKADTAKGETEPPSVTESRLKVEALQASSVGKMLMHTENDKEYQAQLAAFKAQGYSPDVLNKFDTVWSQKAIEKAKSLTMTAKEAEELKIQGKNAETAAAREKREESSPAREDPLHSKDMQEYNAARSEYDKNHPPNQRPVTLVADPTSTNPNHMKPVPTPPRKEFQSFEEWRAATKKRDENGKPMTAPVGPVAPPPVAPAAAVPPPLRPPPPPQAAPVAPVAPPAAAAPPPAAVVPPAAAGRPALPPRVTPPPQVAPPAPAVAGPVGGGAQAGGVILTINQDGKPPKHIRFKDQATLEAFAKKAGLVSSPK